MSARGYAQQLSLARQFQEAQQAQAQQQQQVRLGAAAVAG